MIKKKLKKSLKLNKENVSSLTSNAIIGGYFTALCPSWRNCETDNCGTNYCGTGGCESNYCNTAMHPLSDPLHCRTCNRECID
ncbi:hypothetical protein ACJD0Z_03590 [Flavobacteriaceae bacterium M23B6Z8]